MVGEADSDLQFRVDRIAAPLRHSVTESIRNAIAVRRFAPGQRLRERELCELTGVSRTLVREALRQLESEGVIVMQPHHGPVVTRLSPEQARGIYDVRRELEGLASVLFATKASPAQREALEKAFEKLKVCLREGDPTEKLNAKNKFYERLVEGAQNEALGDTLRMLNSRVTVLRATSLQAAGRTVHSIAELETLMSALRAGDAEAARAAAVNHVDNAAEAAVAQLSSDPS